MEFSRTRYLIITPARNEEGFIEQTIRSVISQTILPLVWVIVDDGSTDGTAAIVRRYQESYPFIRLLSRTDRGYKKAGYADLENFNFGLRSVEALASSCDFVAKLDADLAFAKDYYEELFRRFAAEPGLGIAGGHCYQQNSGRLFRERIPDFHVRGATKVYRHRCLAEIGPLAEVPGWDGVDELRARMKGWVTWSYRDLPVTHLRATTSAASGAHRGSLAQGRISYFLGYHPLFLTARAAKRMLEPPILTGGLAMLAGYISGWLARASRFEDLEFQKYLRREQLRRLFYGWTPPGPKRLEEGRQ